MRSEIKLLTQPVIEIEEDGVDYLECEKTELEVLQKMAKEREKAIVLYTNAGRKDLARIESKELDCIKKMIPKEPSEQEIEELIAELMEATTLTIKDTKDVIADVQDRFPTAQKSTIVRIFKSLL